MARFRDRIERHSRLAALVVAAALLLRLLVPTGYMPDFSSGRIGITLCSGFGPMPPMADMPGMARDKHDAGHGHHDRSDMPCGFSALSAPGLAGADPIQLALAVLFVVSAARFAVAVLRPTRAPRLRPPLRGPPAIA